MEDSRWKIARKQLSVKSLSSFLYLLSSIFYPLSSILSPLLLLWLLTLPALTPLLQPTLTRSADGLLHLYRMVALDQMIRQGVFFSRWLPDLAYGYGLPLFVFYAPLSYYLMEGWHLLGLDAVGAYNASAALALLLAGTGVYLWVKDIYGTRAGMLAGVAYVYAPYQIFTLFSRGSLPITWAGALFPLAFWAFGRLVRSQQRRYLPLSSFILGAALLMHNISSLIFLPLLILYLGIELFFTLHASRFTLQTSLRLGLALALGLALSAFFWLPATLEKEFVQVQRVITPPDFDYHANFVSLSLLFSLPHPANTGLLNPTDPLTLGLAQVVLAAIGLAIWVVFYLQPSISPAPLLPRSPAPLLFATLSLAALIFMMLPLSVGVWDRLPLIAFVQQPHRLLSVTAFLLAILSGAAVAAPPARLSFGLTVVGISLIFVSAVPLLYPRYYDPLPAPASLTGMMTYEQSSGAIGTTSFGEYLPVWVKQTPHESPLLPLYQAGATIERLDRTYLPAEAIIEAAHYGVNQADLTLTAPEPYQAVFHTFYFPGWQATIDGQPAAIAPVTERGLIGVSMPAGRHQLYLSFGETPLRLAANGLSILALLFIMGLAVFPQLAPLAKPFESERSKQILPSPSQEEGSGERLTGSQLVILITLALALILSKTLYLDHFDSPLKRVFSGPNGTGAEVARQVNFGHQLNLLGYDLPEVEVTSGQTFDLTVYWQARQPLGVNYSALAQLVDEQQHLYAGQDNLHPGNLPTHRWEPWGFVQDRHSLRVPPGTPPGNYFLVTGLYNPASWARLPVVEGGDSGWVDVIAIPVRVTKPDQPPSLAELGITWPLTKQTFEALEISKVWPIRLLGATPERQTIQRSDFLRVALFWETVEIPLPDYQISLRLVAADGTAPLAETAPPSFGRYPMTAWAAGERVRDNRALWIPPDFPAGNYRLQIQLVNEAGQPAGEWVELGQLKAE